MSSATHPPVVTSVVEVHASSPMAFDDVVSWNTTPTSSLGAASPTDGSQRNSAVGMFPSDTKGASPLQRMAQTAMSSEEGGIPPNDHASPYGSGLREVPSPLPPTSPGSCLLTHTLPPSPEPRNRSAEYFLSSSTGKRSTRSDSEDEVVGVTADGELLFRLRDGSVGRRPSAADNATTHDGSASQMPIRPTPHRSLPMPGSERVSLRSAVETEGVATPPEVRSLFANPPSQTTAPQRTTSVVAHLSAEDLRFTQLALRLRDRENDVYTEHVHEELRRWDAVCTLREQHALRERFVKTSWDLRRF